MKKTLTKLMAAGCLAGLTGVSWADSSTALSDMSVGASRALGASGVVVAGSALVAGSVVVVGVSAVAGSTVLVVKGASDAAATSVQVSAELARQLGVAVGTAVTVVACSTGQVLIVSGRILAFIPNEIGVALVHSSRVPQY